MALIVRKENELEFINRFLRELEEDFREYSEQYEAINHKKMTGLWYPVNKEDYETLRDENLRSKINQISEKFIVDGYAYEEEFKKLSRESSIHVELKDAKKFYEKR